MATFLRQSPNADKHVLVNAIPGHLSNEAHNDLAVRINALLKHRCDKQERLHYVNCNPALKPSNFVKNSHLFSDVGKDSFAAHLTTSLGLIKNFVQQPLKQQE